MPKGCEYTHDRELKNSKTQIEIEYTARRNETNLTKPIKFGKTERKLNKNHNILDPKIKPIYVM